MRRGLKKEIGPQGPLERIYLTDISHLEWEIRRLRRAKVALLNGAFRDTLEAFIPELLSRSDRELWECRGKARDMSFAWFAEREVQERVSKRLARYGLDATAIEAKVLQSCYSSLADFDRLLASAESRRLKAVRALAEYRASLRRHIARDDDADKGEGSA